MSDGYVWTPSPEVVEAANTTRFARAHDLDGHADLLRRSIDEPEWFWDAVVRWLDVEFHTPYRQVLDHTGGIQACRWFTGATLNLAWSCVGRHAQSEASARSAVIAEREDGAVEVRTYAELAADIARLAGGLRALGVEPGDRVALAMPMSCAG